MKKSTIKQMLRNWTSDPRAYMHSIMIWMNNSGLYFKDIKDIKFIRHQLFIYVQFNNKLLLGAII